MGKNNVWDAVFNLPNGVHLWIELMLFEFLLSFVNTEKMNCGKWALAALESFCLLSVTDRELGKYLWSGLAV